VLIAEIDRAPRVVDRRFDLASVPDDPALLEETIHVACGVPGDGVDIEVGKCAAEVVALLQDRQPAQAGLEPLETDLLEQSRVVGDGAAPLFVVVLDVQRIGAAPPAARDLGRGSPVRGLRSSMVTCPRRHRYLKIPRIP
jgi:hypothetical protein